MERVAFLIEETNERIGCLLNPESLVMRRVSGVHPRRSLSGYLAGAGLSDDPLLYTGGGRTELELSLLFDVQLEGSTTETEDVRDLTAPFWQLAENRAGADGYGEPPVVRFIWGKAWNIPGVITAVSEHLEYFSASGCPQRSWMRLRMARVPDTTPLPVTETVEEIQRPEQELTPETLEDVVSPNPEQTRTHEVQQGERLEEIAAQYYGNSFFWRVIAIANNLADPTDVPAGAVLTIPPIKTGKKPGGGSP